MAVPTSMRLGQTSGYELVGPRPAGAGDEVWPRGAEGEGHLVAGRRWWWMSWGDGREYRLAYDATAGCWREEGRGSEAEAWREVSYQPRSEVCDTAAPPKDGTWVDKDGDKSTLRWEKTLVPSAVASAPAGAVAAKGKGGGKAEPPAAGPTAAAAGKGYKATPDAGGVGAAAGKGGKAGTPGMGFFPTMPTNSRMAPMAEEVSTTTPLTLTRAWVTCRQAVCLDPLFSMLRDVEEMLRRVDLKVMQLKWEQENDRIPRNLTEDELFAMAAYTYDHGRGQERNLYFELNKMLRKRGPEARKLLRKVFGDFLWYLLQALDKLPPTQGLHYRGYPDKEVALREYQKGRPICWGACSSTSKDANAAKEFTDRDTGVIFELDLLNGKDITPYSMFSGEEEVLLNPNGFFVVLGPPEKRSDGYTYICMLEQRGGPFYS